MSKTRINARVLLLVSDTSFERLSSLNQKPWSRPQLLPCPAPHPGYPRAPHLSGATHGMSLVFVPSSSSSQPIFLGYVSDPLTGLPPLIRLPSSPFSASVSEGRPECRSDCDTPVLKILSCSVECLGLSSSLLALLTRSYMTHLSNFISHLPT